MTGSYFSLVKMILNMPVGEFSPFRAHRKCRNVHGLMWDACVTVVNVSVFKGQEPYSWLEDSRQLAFQTVKVVPGRDIRSVICFMLRKQSCADDSQKQVSLQLR